MNIAGWKYTFECVLPTAFKSIPESIRKNIYTYDGFRYTREMNMSKLICVKLFCLCWCNTSDAISHLPGANRIKLLPRFEWMAIVLEYSNSIYSYIYPIQFIAILQTFQTQRNTWCTQWRGFVILVSKSNIPSWSWKQFVMRSKCFCYEHKKDIINS